MSFVEAGAIQFSDIIIEDCVKIFKHFEEVLFVFTGKSANKGANLLAHAIYYMPDPMEWYDTVLDLILI